MKNKRVMLKATMLLILSMFLFTSCEKTELDCADQYDLIVKMNSITVDLVQNGQPIENGTVHYYFTKYRCDGTSTPIGPGKIVTNSIGYGKGDMIASFHLRNDEDYILVKAWYDSNEGTVEMSERITNHSGNSGGEIEVGVFFKMHF